MKIIIIGGTGTIGEAVAKELGKRHDIIIVGTKSGDVHADISDSKTIENMYKKINNIDAVVITAGKVHFEELTKMTIDEYYIGLNNKLMGQVNTVLMGIQYINPNGSFTLTSGILNHDPIRYGASAAMVNGALEGFVKSAAIEMPKQLRINVVSPTVLKESLPDYETYFYGFPAVPATAVALAYSKSVEGLQTGQIYRVGH
jgi:NAD(P)-dependent dehydrogenase (short-subunit alcohol dehydrogenase family)